MTTWRHFARREFSRVISDLGLPCATSRHDLDRCPLHDEPVGPTTRLCATCFHEAWDEVAPLRRRRPRRRQKGEPMSTDSELVHEGELVPYDPPSAPITLFCTSDPRIALERMSEIASALVDVIESKHLFATINGRRHITAEGWMTLGGMLGVVPVVTETRPNDSGDGIVARVEARTLDGRVVGAAEAECSRAERTWKSRDPYALRSMAQTRAISRALRAPLGQIIVLAGYDATGAEEMLADTESESVVARTDGQGKLPDEIRPTRDQFEQVAALIDRLTELDPAIDWKAKTRELAGVDATMLTRAAAAGLIRQLAKLAGQDEPA